MIGREQQCGILQTTTNHHGDAHVINRLVHRRSKEVLGQVMYSLM